MAKDRTEGPLTGHVFCFTRGADATSNDGARPLVERFWATTSSSATSRVVDVVADARAGSTPEKPPKLGLAVVGW